MGLGPAGSSEWVSPGSALGESASTAWRSGLGKARLAVWALQPGPGRSCGAGLTEFARAVGLALVQIHPAGARARLGAGLRVPPRLAEARRRRGRGPGGRHGGARPVGVGGAGGRLRGARGRPRGWEAQGPGA